MTCRRVFFSSDWDDAWRTMQVRNSDVVKMSGLLEARFYDAADIEQVKRNDPLTIQRWIDEQMKGTSVTCVLIGEHTSESSWVTYEIEQSINLGKGLFGVYIHNVKGQNREKGKEGKNPLPEGYPTYDWEDGNGRENLPSWIEDAYEYAGKGPQSPVSLLGRKIALFLLS